MIIPILSKYKRSLIKYLEKHVTEGMLVEPLPIEGEGSVDDVLAALSSKIDVMFKEIATTSHNI